MKILSHSSDKIETQYYRQHVLTPKSKEHQYFGREDFLKMVATYRLEKHYFGEVSGGIFLGEEKIVEYQTTKIAVLFGKYFETRIDKVGYNIQFKPQRSQNSKKEWYESYNWIPMIIKGLDKDVAIALLGLQHLDYIAYSSFNDVQPCRNPKGHRMRSIIVWVNAPGSDPIKFEEICDDIRSEIKSKYNVFCHVYRPGEKIEMPALAYNCMSLGMNFYINDGFSMHHPPNNYHVGNRNYSGFIKQDDPFLQKALSNVNLKSWKIEDVSSGYNPIEKFPKPVLPPPPLGPNDMQAKTELRSIQSKYYGGAKSEFWPALKLLLFVKFNRRDEIANVLNLSTAAVSRLFAPNAKIDEELVDKLATVLEVDKSHIEELRTTNSYEAFTKQEHLKPYYQKFSKYDFSKPASEQKVNAQ